MSGKKMMELTEKECPALPFVIIFMRSDLYLRHKIIFMRSSIRYVFLIAACLLCASVKAARVDTVDTFSPSMNKSIKAVVVTPDSYTTHQGLFPVVYLLHGYGGNYASWINAVPSLKGLSDQLGMIIVCPDGNIGSWYFDSPADPAWRYETYVSSELVQWIDKRYKSVKDRSGRAITGLSMGGHGAMFLSFRHQDVFGAAGSMSGGVDFRPFPRNWEIAKRLGTYAASPDVWEKNTAINMIDLVKPGSLALIIDCGTEDFFFDVNNNFHQKLLDNKITHDYIVRAGAHNWKYWNNSIAYQLLFMSRFFNKL